MSKSIFKLIFSIIATLYFCLVFIEMMNGKPFFENFVVALLFTILAKLQVLDD